MILFVGFPGFESELREKTYPMSSGVIRLRVGLSVGVEIEPFTSLFVRADVEEIEFRKFNLDIYEIFPNKAGVTPAQLVQRKWILNLNDSYKHPDAVIGGIVIK